MTAQLADVLAWVLIHSLWQGVCVAAAALVVLRATPARYCNLRYATCITGLFVTVLAMLVTGSALTLERQPVDGSTGVFSPAQSTTATAAATTSAPSIPTAIGSRERSATMGASRLSKLPASPVRIPPSPQWPVWLIGGWLIGVAVMILRTVVAIIQVRHWRRAVVDVDPLQFAQLAAVLQQMCDRLQFRRAVALIVSERVRVPAVLGVFSPCILVPASMLTGISIDHWQVILAHELAHIRRYDALVNLVQMLIESVLFFNPAVWWLSHQIRVEREACCDALAAKVCGESFTVARTLVEFAAGLTATGRNDAASAALAGFADPAQPGELTDRVQRLVDPDVAAFPQVSWWGLLMVMGSLSLTGIALSWGTDVAVKTALYVISPKERVAQLERLQNQTTGDYFPLEPEGNAVANLTGQSIDVENALSKVAPQFSVTIVVRTEDGQPLPPGTRIVGVTRAGNSGSTGTIGHISREVPEFRETHIYSPCLLRIAVGCPGYAEAISPIVDLLSGEQSRTMELVLNRGSTVRLHFRDSAGSPIPGVRLMASATMELQSRRATTWSNELSGDQAGVITMPGTGRHMYRLKIRARGFEQIEFDREFQPSETATIVLEKAEPVTFHVVDSATGQPIPQARVLVVTMSSTHGTNGQSFGDPRRDGYFQSAWNTYGETDPSGQLVLDELHAEFQYAIAVLADGYGMGLIQDVRAGQPPVNVKLSPPFKLAGRIVGAVERLPAVNSNPGEKVQRALGYSYSVTRNNYNSAERVILDDAGRFEIGDLIAGQEVTLNLPDRTERFFITKSIAGLELRIESEGETKTRDVVIRLTGVTAGAPARGTLFVSCGNPDPSIRFDRQGPRVLSQNEVKLNFAVGTELYIRPDKLVGYQIDEVKGIVTAGTGSQVIEIPARPSGGIHTTIVRADGSPATDGYVHVYPVRLPPGLKDGTRLNPSTHHTSSDVLSQLPLGGTYRLIAYERNPERISCALSDEVSLDELHPIAELMLQLPGGNSLPIRVLRPDGTPARGVTLELSPDIEWGKFMSMTTKVARVADEEGVALFRNVVANASIAPLKLNLTARVLPSSYRGWSGNIDLKNPAVIQLQPGLTASGTLVEVDTGKAIPNARLRLVPLDREQAKYTGDLEAVTDLQGRFRFEGMEPLEYSVYLPGKVIRTSEGDVRFQYPPEHESLTVRAGQHSVVLKVQVKPGSRLKVAD